MKKYKLFALALVAVLCFVLLGGCGSSENSQTPDDGQEKASYWETQQFESLSGTDFIKVGESGTLQLLLNPSTGTVRWMDTSTGKYQDTNMAMDESGVNKSANMQSDVIVRYFSGSVNANALYTSTSTYDSYTMSASLGQLSYQLIDNGVRIVYMLGDDSITYKNFPNRISNERMQEYVLQYLDGTQAETLRTRYYTQLSTGDWLRNFGGGEGGSQNRLGTLGMNEVYNLFYVVGHYTDELLYEDLELSEAGADQYPSNLKIYVPLDFYLEGNELVVRLDTSLLETDDVHPINQIQLLPYFLTSHADDDEEEGYMFIPDGSGALIYLDSKKTREYHYQASYYDGDLLGPSAQTYKDVDNKMQMPVFGMKNSDTTIFAVIEQGAEVATLDAYVSGTDNSEPFSKLRLTFDIQAQQRLTSGASNASGDFFLYKASSDIYDEDIVLRYFWLGEDATYMDMANTYAAYLEEKGILTKNAQEEDPPFFVEFLGATDKTKYMLGIPYEGAQSLTTFAQAKEMLEDMTADGVKNVKLIYSGIVNGGINQRSLAGGVKFAPGLGGNGPFKELISYASSIGTTVYPNMMLQTVYTKTKLSKNLVAWNMINERGQMYNFDPINRAINAEDEFPRYIIAPDALGSYLSKVKSNFTGRTGLTSLASEDLYSFVATNYSEDIQVSPSTGADILEETVKEFSDGFSLMLSNPIVDAYAYADYLMDVPVENSGMRVLDASIPFMGMVLNGHIQYSAESSNRESTDVFLNIMHAIESNAQPKFTLMYENSSLLTGTEQENYFAVDYTYWKDQIGEYYTRYREFYDAVKNATIVDHEIYNRNDKLRVETYSNGVKVYFNYSDLDEVIDGVTVPAFTYLIQ